MSRSWGPVGVLRRVSFRGFVDGANGLQGRAGAERRSRARELVFCDWKESQSWRWECGNPGAVGGIPKGLLERGGGLLLALHAFHSTVISTVPAAHGLRQRANNSGLIFCMRRAASVSLIADAWPCSIQICFQLIPIRIKLTLFGLILHGQFSRLRRAFPGGILRCS